jgi:hypothetical protein
MLQLHGCHLAGDSNGFASYGSYLVGKAIWSNQVREMSSVWKDNDLTLGHRCAHPVACTLPTPIFGLGNLSAASPVRVIHKRGVSRLVSIASPALTHSYFSTDA